MQSKKLKNKELVKRSLLEAKKVGENFDQLVHLAITHGLTRDQAIKAVEKHCGKKSGPRARIISGGLPS